MVAFPPERWLERIAASAMALLAIGGGALAWPLFAPPQLPLPLEKLPKDLTRIESIDTDAAYAAELDLRVEDLPEEARWSNAALLCGGEDVFGALFDPDRVGGRRRVAELMADKEQAKATLSCGKAVAQATRDCCRGFVMTIADGHDVATTPFGGKELPSTPPFDCARAIAKVANEPLWLLTDASGLKAFADGFSPDGKNQTETKDRMLKELRGLSGTVVVVGTKADGALPSTVSERSLHHHPGQITVWEGSSRCGAGLTFGMWEPQEGLFRHVKVQDDRGLLFPEMERGRSGGRAEGCGGDLRLHR